MLHAKRKFDQTKDEAEFSILSGLKNKNRYNHMKQKISTGSPWEDIVGYSRGVRVGNIIEIAGTTSSKDGTIVGVDDAYTQTITILQTIADAIVKLGGTMDDVVRTRIFVTNIAQWEDVGRAHGEVFKNIKPVTAIIEVSKLIHPDMLVEIEATAILE